MNTCACGAHIGAKAKMCVVCRNRRLAEAARVVYDADYIRDRVDIDAAGCWNWQGALRPDGYGCVSRKSGEGLAHRLSYRVNTGREITHQLDHLCRNRQCVNPDHLDDVPQRVNMHRAPHIIEQMARTRCPRGHEYAGDNLRVVRGKRTCRACAALARDRHRGKHQTAASPR